MYGVQTVDGDRRVRGLQTRVKSLRTSDMSSGPARRDNARWLGAQATTVRWSIEAEVFGARSGAAESP